MAKKKTSDTFEIVVILAIVAIVALTGQVLIYFDSAGTTTSTSETGGLLSGLVVADETQPKTQFNDVSVERIETNPVSPLLGDPFEVKVIVKNKGTKETTTPFYIDASFQPKSDESTVEMTPIVLQSVMTKNLMPDEEASVSFLVTTIMPEGPLRIIASADSTGKLQDDNTANNQLSKTIIVAIE